MTQDEPSRLGHQGEGQPLDLGGHAVARGHAMHVVEAETRSEVGVTVGAGQHHEDPAIRGIVEIGGEAAPGARELDASPLAVPLHLAVRDDEDEAAVARGRSRGVDGVEDLRGRRIFVRPRPTHGPPVEPGT